MFSQLSVITTVIMNRKDINKAISQAKNEILSGPFVIE